MEGKVLGSDANTGDGVITDQAGNRYTFKRSDWKSPGEPAPGRQVDFTAEGNRAVDIYLKPGSTPFNIGHQDPEKQAVIFGSIALACGVLTFFLGVIGIVTVVLAVIFGIKGKNIGAELEDKTGYYLSVAGLALAGIALLITLLALTACAGLVGILGGIGLFH